MPDARSISGKECSGLSFAMLIINADDFGRSANINRAILEGFRLGLCSSATIMPNMPGFEEACQMARDHGLLDHIGVHLTLVEGHPLTDRIKKLSKFCDGEGRLRVSTSKSLLLLERSEKEALAAEIRAQIDRCHEFGLPVTHLDSHHHLHNLWGVLEVVLPVARAEGVPYLRIARNCGPSIGLATACYKGAVNYKITRACLRRTKYFGGVADYKFLRGKIGAERARRSFEIMVHPRFGTEGVLIDGKDVTPLAETVGTIDSYESAVSFTGGDMIRVRASFGRSN